MPCKERSLRLTASSAPPSSSTHLHFAILRLVFPLDQTPPHQPPPATCWTSIQPRHLPLRYNLQYDQQEFHFFVLLMLFLFYNFHADFINYLPFLISFSIDCIVICCPFQVPSEKDTLYLHLLFALKDPSVGTLESNFASTVFYAFSALQVQYSSRHDLLYT